MTREHIAVLLTARDTVPAHKPWPRHEVDHITWTKVAEGLGAGQGEMLTLFADGGMVHMALRSEALHLPCVVSCRVIDGGFPSVARHHPPATRLERTIRDLFGIQAWDTPDQRPWLDHGVWGVRAPLGANLSSPPRDPADYAFDTVEGDGLRTMDVGPADAMIGQPAAFRLTLRGDTVVRAEERLGYAHRGVDALLCGADIETAGRIVARVCGDSTVAYSFAFARAVELALGITVPDRGAVLRGVMAELERIAGHLSVIGAAGRAASFDLLDARCAALREHLLATLDRVFAHRLMMDEIIPGGVVQNLSAAGVSVLLTALDAAAEAVERIVALYGRTRRLRDRIREAGQIQRHQAMTWGAGGPVGRAAGRDFDARRDLAYPPYEAVVFHLPALTEGDADARVRLCLAEVASSLALVRHWLGNLPDGPVLADIVRVGEPREGVAVVEAPRGDVLVWARLDADGRVARCHIRDASWFQWPLLEKAMEGARFADLPVCLASFSCSVAGHDL